jgi:hypothetical protein
MKWIKKGLIFNLKESKFSHLLFAQSPQAIIFEDFVRIFFSTRKIDSYNTFLSVIGYVDYDKHWNIINLNTDNIIGLGGLGEFDEHGIFPINPLKVGDEIWAYTTGWSRRVSVSVETSIGLALSKDRGTTFKKIGRGGPIMSSSYKEPILVGDAFVKRYNNKFYMWYIFGQEWLKSSIDEPEARIYKIAQSNSEDGINWERNGQPIIEDIISNECQALPTVIQIDKTYHMYFCFRYATDFRTNPLRGYKLGYAFSKDLKKWMRNDSKVGISLSSNSWDSEMICYPNLFEWDSKVYLLYNGNDFGRWGFGLAELIEV